MEESAIFCGRKPIDAAALWPNKGSRWNAFIIEGANDAIKDISAAVNK